MSIVSSTPATSARVTITALATPDNHLDFQRAHGYSGNTRTIRLSRVKIVWSIDLMADEPKWEYREKVVGVNVRKDGTDGAPVELWEYGFSRGEKWPELTAFVNDAIEKSRPTAIPTATIDLGV